LVVQRVEDVRPIDGLPHGLGDFGDGHGGGQVVCEGFDAPEGEEDAEGDFDAQG
jgi:hypothetical protein